MVAQGIDLPKYFIGRSFGISVFDASHFVLRLLHRSEEREEKYNWKRKRNLLRFNQQNETLNDDKWVESCIIKNNDMLKMYMFLCLS